MKKILYLVLTVFIAASCSSGGSQADSSDSTNTNSTENSTPIAGHKYGIKSGIIYQETEAMGMKMNPVVYFDDYGKIECTETTMEIMGMKVRSITLSKDGFIYNIDMEKKTGSKMKSYGSTSSVDFSSLTEEMKNKMNLKEIGSEEYLGKSCKKYSMDYKDMDMKGTFLVYENIPMKAEATIGKMETKVIVVKFEENATIPAEKFEIPADVTITDADATMNQSK